MSRIFSTSAWIAMVCAAALIPLILAAVLEKLRVTSPARTIISTIAGLWFLALVVVPGSLKFGLPDIGHLAEAGRLGWLNALDATTLLKPQPGALLLACAGIWGAMLISEPVAAAGRPVLASLAWIGLFALVSANAGPSGRSISVLVFITGLLAGLYWIKKVPDATDAKPRRAHPQARVVAAGWASVLGAIAAVTGVAFAGAVPGYESPPWISNLPSGPSSRTVVSPLVEIKPQLLNQRRAKVFEVKASVPAGTVAYWRLMALDRFDGNSFGAAADYKKVIGPITYPPSELFRGRRVSISQSYRIDGLASLWLPAAYQATKISGARVSIDPESSSVIARSRINNGADYQVTSKAPDPLAEDLQNAPPPTGVEQYTKLVGVGDGVYKIAQSWTAGKRTQYEKVVAISDRLRKFRYDENVKAGHSSNYLLYFLTRSKAGYCEQFAASMAILARTLGIPARVAVGFLPGTLDASKGSYSVTTRDAHAWPEVFFEGVGWVAFEPTPRSGISQPDYANPAAPADQEQQQGSAAQQEQQESQPEPQPPEPTIEPPTPPPPPPSSQAQTNPAPKWWLWPAASLIAILLAFGMAAAIKKIRARRRYRRALTSAERIQAAFFDFEDRAIDLSRQRKIAQTPAEFVEEVRHGFGLDQGAAAILIGSFERAVFSPRLPSEPEAAEALAAAALLTGQLWARASWVGRLGLLASPRSLLMRSPRGSM